MAKSIRQKLEAHGAIMGLEGDALEEYIARSMPRESTKKKTTKKKAAKKKASKDK